MRNSNSRAPPDVSVSVCGEEVCVCWDEFRHGGTAVCYVSLLHYKEVRVLALPNRHLRVIVSLAHSSDSPTTKSAIYNRKSEMFWCPRRDSNPEPTDYESAALTVELQGHNNLRAVDL